MTPAAMARGAAAAAILTALMFEGVHGQVSFERLREAAGEPRNWLTYSGGYFSQRYSALDQITPANVTDLALQWVYQSPSAGTWQPTPIVVDGVMYLTQRPNDVVALDARTGRVFWIYSYPTPSDHKACCGANNRGVAVLGDRVFMATLDAHVVALDAATGAELWNVEVADKEVAYAFTLAPLAVKDKVLVGSTGGDQGIRGFIAALDAATGAEAWRFHTIPGPGEPGHETWEPCPPNPETYCDPEAWKHGGGAAWITGSYDPELNLIYWGTGNPGPDFNRAQRPGDNLYTSSVVAVDADTGRIRWHFQFTPGDPYDYDSVQIPVLADIERGGTLFQGGAVGQPQRVLLRAGPGDGPFPERAAVHQRELGGGPGRQRASRSRRRSRRARPPIRASTAERTGTRRHSVRARSCSTSRPGRTTPRSSETGRRNTRKASTSPAAASARTSRRRMPQPCRHSAAARSTTGPTRSATAPCWRSTRSPASRSGSSR